MYFHLLNSYICSSTWKPSLQILRYEKYLSVGSSSLCSDLWSNWILPYSHSFIFLAWNKNFENVLSSVQYVRTQNYKTKNSLDINSNFCLPPILNHHCLITIDIINPCIIIHYYTVSLLLLILGSIGTYCYYSFYYHHYYWKMKNTKFHYSWGIGFENFVFRKVYIWENKTKNMRTWRSV